MESNPNRIQLAIEALSGVTLDAPIDPDLEENQCSGCGVSVLVSFPREFERGDLCWECLDKLVVRLNKVISEARQHLIDYQASGEHADIERIRSGRFTAEEIHNFCHNLHGTVSAKEFADGCAAEQRRLYGCAPHADRVVELENR